MTDIEAIDHEDPQVAHDLREFAEKNYQIPVSHMIESWLNRYRALSQDYQTSDLEVLRAEIERQVVAWPNLRLRLDIVSVPGRLTPTRPKGAQF